MNRPSAAYLDKITAVAEQWVRYCNGKPAPGGPVSAAGLRVVLASSRNVRTEDDGTIVWTGYPGEFTAKPVRDGATP